MPLIDRIDIDSYKPLLADYLQSKHGITNLKEPFRCLEPSHIDEHPSMTFTSKYNICKCFSCGKSYDIFDLIGLDYGLNSFREQLEMASKLYPDISAIPLKQFEVYDGESKTIDFTYYFQKCSSQINQTDYLSKRKIELSLLKKYHIGFDAKREMVIFPINSNCYFARSINGSSKIKSKGTSYLWNENMLKNSENKLIYITESIIDSLSLETIDPNVKTIALNGLPNYKRLLKVIEENNYNGYLVLAFDNDKTGLTYQSIVKEELAKLNVSSFPITLISNFADENCKDLNEALIKNREQLEKNYKYFNENFNKIIEQKSKEKGGEIEVC